MRTNSSDFYITYPDLKPLARYPTQTNKSLYDTSLNLQSLTIYRVRELSRNFKRQGWYVEVGPLSSILELQKPYLLDSKCIRRDDEQAAEKRRSNPLGGEKKPSLTVHLLVLGYG